MNWEKIYLNAFGGLSAQVFRTSKGWKYSLSRDGDSFHEPPGVFLTAKRAMQEAESIASILDAMVPKAEAEAEASPEAEATD